jgi:hypothetical protein
MRPLLPYISLLLLSIKLHAQVLVHEEPRHRPVFQNDKLRMLDVLLPPGDTTQYHIHHTPSLFIYFSSTSTGSQLKEAAPSKGRSTAGSVSFENLSAPRVRIHRVWNIDTNSLHVMDIELLKDSGFSQKPIKHPQLRLAIDTPWVRVYKLELEANSEFILTPVQGELVLVSTSAGRVQSQQGNRKDMQTLSPGSFFLIKPGESFRLQNTGAMTTRCVLTELPDR